MQGHMAQIHVVIGLTVAGQRHVSAHYGQSLDDVAQSLASGVQIPRGEIGVHGVLLTFPGGFEHGGWRCRDSRGHPRGCRGHAASRT